MGLVSGIVVFVCIWWTVIFCVLPIGQSTQYEQQEDGIAPGAPKNLDMKKKVMITTAITAVLWVVAYIIIDMDIISFREWAKQS